MNTLVEIIIIGAIATLATDIWGLARKPLLGVAPPDYGMVGRWIAHMQHGQFRHAAIGKSPSAPAERILGWAVHYLIGVAFAALLVAICGTDWLQSPTLMPALGVGLGTVLAPFFIMQPGMGAGLAARKTPRPNAARMHSLLMHTIFGFGLYLGGRVIEIGHFIFL